MPRAKLCGIKFRGKVTPNGIRLKIVPRPWTWSWRAMRQPELVPLRIGRMAASPSAFLRGAAAVMAWDLSHTPITGIQTLIDGDAHINNFGLYFWGFVCGTLLAHAHCRNGDAAKMAGYCGKSEVLDETLADFAEAYGDQTETDHAALVQAVQQGRVKAVEGV